jgi:D-ribose pyranase
MKKTGLLNQPISAVIAGLGHSDTLVIADAGLPIPPETQRIDLALTAGIPTFLDTLRTVLSEMQVERAIVAEEILDASPKAYQHIRELLGDVPIETVPHLIFKEQSCSARAVIRTGEFTPYANIILVAGVVF